MNIHLKLRLGLVSALVLLLGLALISQKRLRVSADHATSVAHTHDVLAALDNVSEAIHGAECSTRGYLLTHARALDTHFSQDRADVLFGLGQVRSLTASNPKQKVHIERLKPLLEQTLASQAASIVSARTDPQKAVATYAASFPDNAQRLQQIDSSFADMRSDAEVFLKQRVRFSNEAANLAALLAGVGTILGVSFVVFCALWISRDLHRCEQAEKSLHQVRESLESRVQERTADLSKTTLSLEAEIAERRNTEAQLRESEQRYRLLFQDSPLPMEVFDPETLCYLAVNTAAAELYGYTPEEFLHMTLLDVRPPEEVTAFAEYLRTVKTADSYNGTFVIRHKNGHLITIEARVRTIEFGGQKARLKLLSDVTEKKRLETQLRQAQKMEAVGRLAGGIAHDFNNLLMVILGYSDSVLNKLDDADPNRAKVSEIHAAGQRAANLTSQLLAFSRKQILQMQNVQLNAVVSNISQMIRRLLGEDIQITLDLDEDLGQIIADAAQLEQVLVNLAVNARDAMPHGGQLVIETRNIELDEKSAAVEGVPAGRYVLLIVNDTGSGMDEATKSKIFEPFFTTKEVGKGTGLGLAMAFGVVQQSGGTITVYSELGLGTTFKIYLPRVDAPAETPAEPQQEYDVSPVSPEMQATILLVEDEKQLRTLAREVLKEAGYTVIEAGNGREALRVAETLSSPPAVLLTDVVMPEMSGLKLAELLQQKWPGLAVIYTSGYTEHALLGRDGLHMDVPFLQKPYMPGALLEQVASVVESHLSVA